MRFQDDACLKWGPMCGASNCDAMQFRGRATSDVNSLKVLVQAGTQDRRCCSYTPHRAAEIWFTELRALPTSTPLLSLSDRDYTRPKPVGHLFAPHNEAGSHLCYMELRNHAGQGSSYVESIYVSK